MDVKIMLISDCIGVVLYALLYYTLYHTYELDYLGSGRWRRWRRIESFEIEESKNCYYSTFVFIDDLCDAGGTFLGELKVLKERYPNSKFIIIVCHAVNDKGLINMCNNFDQVIVSNSHRDINYRPSNENLTVIDVCK